MINPSAGESESISLVIASHRRGARIGLTLESVFAQTQPVHEVVVLNDGGWAETREYIASHYPSVVVVDAECGSAAAARNRGAAFASHPLIIFLDDDDRLHPHAVATLAEMLQTFPEAQAAFADHTFTDLATGQHRPDHHHTLPSFQRLHWARPRRAIGNARLYDQQLYYPMLRGGLLQQPWIVRRDAFQSLGGFDEAFPCHEDWELFLRLVQRYPIALTDRVISDHRVEPGREHVSRSARLEQTSGAIIRKHLKLAARRIDISAAVILLRRLGMHHKTLGDELFPNSPFAAWREYLSALLCWPFDLVVLARAGLLWPGKILWRGFFTRREEHR